MNLESLNLIDMISERHLQLRKLSESLWDERSDIYLAKSERFILARIYQKGETTISSVTKNVDISRQATHKFIKQLEQKGLVHIKAMEHNKKERSITLTNFGKECYRKNESLESMLEKQIAENIGTEKVTQLKEILKLDWGL
ncbi:MarR family winged helix-turn-helix transcriptional regulator [Lentibacillus sp. CBA3610]|uniref:MarR family winged helix-turn-helix transcriptional regulator n=1 Tax=Lentibacillus sp. CBA3610 TaxID=2518176 RepID=UPI001595438C|nr:MarR family transcriptional regulator [Lentibacillus sp. CBA3610]QKY68283.1 MarR family transcriptional regulator [Lentibacillus sp. CBA3610]